MHDTRTHLLASLLRSRTVALGLERNLFIKRSVHVILDALSQLRVPQVVVHAPDVAQQLLVRALLRDVALLKDDDDVWVSVAVVLDMIVLGHPCDRLATPSIRPRAHGRALARRPFRTG